MAHGNNFVRFVFVHNAEGKGAAKLFDAGNDGFFQRTAFFIFAVYEMYRRFGIRFGMKDKSFGLKHAAQFLIVFNNSVMYQYQPAVVGKVRMRVCGCGFAVRCPADVSDAEPRRKPFAGWRFQQFS